MAIVVVNSYSEANQTQGLLAGASYGAYKGQSFLCSTSVRLDSFDVYIKKTNVPTGNVTCALYAHTGTFGTTSKATGSALATSSTVDIASLSTSYALVRFNFTGANRVLLSASTHYVLVIIYSGGDANNRLEVGIDSTSPAHAGNLTTSSDNITWSSSTFFDICFYVYGEEVSSYSISMEAGSFSLTFQPFTLLVNLLSQAIRNKQILYNKTRTSFREFMRNWYKRD